MFFPSRCSRSEKCGVKFEDENQGKRKTCWMEIETWSGRWTSKKLSARGQININSFINMKRALDASSCYADERAWPQNGNGGKRMGMGELW